MAWSYASVAQAGPDKAECQDAVAIRELDGGLAIAISDGAGSAKFGAEAAQLTAHSAVELIEEPSSEILEELKCRLRQIAKGRPMEDFACTLVMLKLHRAGSVFWQIGDGGAVVRSESGLTWLGGEGGEYMNVTTFVHEVKTLAPRELTETIDAATVFSDGIQHLVIDPITSEIHSPFFDRLFSAPTQAGRDERASAWLEAMALSAPVRSRTDDDIGIAVARWMQ